MMRNHLSAKGAMNPQDFVALSATLVDQADIPMRLWAKWLKIV